MWVCNVMRAVHCASSACHVRTVMWGICRPSWFGHPLQKKCSLQREISSCDVFITGRPFGRGVTELCRGRPEWSNPLGDAYIRTLMCTAQRKEYVVRHSKKHL